MRVGDTGVQGIENASLSAVSPDGRSREVEIGDGGAFRIPASEGVWRLVVRPSGDGAVVRREVVVRDAPVRLSALVFRAADRAPEGRPVEIDFNRISEGPLAKPPPG